ncbi:MAG TPA: phosphonoacetaldehyde reductase [Micromonosporaceae bacterium]|nr:phosphonoacetaldehyde reductase [Micromonosporaceae bacterium]
MATSFRPGRVLLVGSDRGIARSRALERLGDLPVQVFSGFRANPVLDDVLDGCRALRGSGADLVVGVGGGSAMDTAKMVRLLPPDRPAALDLLRGAPPDDAVAVPPLVVVPTTAGTGSEVTQFATVYVDGIKHSLDTDRARPDVAVVDPLLTATCPPALMFSCAFDALSHALESYWSIRSTLESRWLAEEAGRGLVELLTTRRLLTDRATMSALALQAGLAINRTRTTVGHAFAYPLTVRYGIPHGLACALALSHLLPAAAANDLQCRDPRGPGFLANRLAGLAGILRVGSPAELGQAVQDLLATAGFATALGSYGVRPQHVEAIVDEALGADRAGGSPVVYDRATAAHALLAAL